jgi:hypothetical protein
MNLEDPKRTERLFSASAKWARRALDVETGAILEVFSDMMIGEVDATGGGVPSSSEDDGPVDREGCS